MNNTHIISRLTLRREKAVYGARALARGPYGFHQMLWNLFDETESPRAPFLYRFSDPRVPMLAVSQATPRDSGGLWRIESKPYDPRLGEGTTLGFTLRANATICRDEKRHDLVMDARTQGDMRPRLVIANETGPKWLARQAEKCGFELAAAYVSAYWQLQTRKPGSSDPIRLGIMEFDGVLRVSDSETFRESLFNGVGRGKAFGCGLLLIRPLS